MLVFTVPKCIRTLLMRNRSLIGLICRIAYETTRHPPTQLPTVDGKPYFIASIQLWGNALNRHA